MIDSRLRADTQSVVSLSPEMQRTLGREIVISGIGIFTGAKSTVRISPAPLNHGIVFQRVDLPGSSLIAARVQNIQESLRCTTVGVDGASVMLVEHLLSALYAYGIDNAYIAVDGPEIPGLDGSALEFVKFLDQAGFETQDALRQWTSLSQPMFWSRGGVHLVALPATEFRVSYTMHYPQSPLIQSQYFSMVVDVDSYAQEIAPCRTFSLYEEVLPLIERGLIRGGGLDSSVVIQGSQVLNPGGLRFADEMVRHKILDLIGDLSLVGSRLLMHVIAICSGHGANAALAKMLSKTVQPRS